MVEYICPKCGKNFSQKNDLTRHLKKKMSCINPENLIKEKSEVDEIKFIFDKCLDILRDNEHIMNDKALRNLSYLFVLKLIEPKLNTIKFENYDYPFDGFDDDVDIELLKQTLFKVLKFSELIKVQEGKIIETLNHLWNEILCVHPITKGIFIKNSGFDIKKSKTFVKLFSILKDFDTSKFKSDVLGNAYELVFKTIMTGDLGQFFTPPIVKKLMVNLIKPKIFSDGTIESIHDPALGTAGFLMTCVNYIENFASFNKINVNWKDVMNKLSGVEAVSETYQLAESNMLISTGMTSENVVIGDSIRNPILEQKDNILTNPPFGIKGLTYQEISNEGGKRDLFMPIIVNSAVPLFLQVIIKTLKIGGKCGIVLPDGQDLFSRNNGLVSVREYLLKTCDLKEIIYFPTGTFTHTSIKTCVAFFIKKRNETEVLKIKDISKTKREYTFTPTHQTHKVKFFDFNT